MYISLCTRNVGSVHATNKNIENELSHTWPRHSKDECSRSLKCSAQDLSVDLLEMRDTQIHPFSHRSDTFASPVLSDYVLGYHILQKSQIRLLPKDQSDPGS